MTSIQNESAAGTAFGRYTLIKPIGRGGMAEVWKAKSHGAQNFQRLVVIKRILPHLSSDPAFVRMFTDEAVVTARLNHPNIVQIFEFSEVAGEHYLAMEYVHGVNLSDIHKRIGDRFMPIGFAAHVVREICLALAYAHGSSDDEGRPQPVIHRDVSPSNVMIGYDGSVKLVDFGVAKVLSQSDDMTRTGALKGKVGYMSPEAIEGELELDSRSDLFSAGVVLYELLTGRRLFKGSDDLRTIALVRACRVPAPSTIRPEVGEVLDRICEKALARDRDERFADALALAAALGQVVRETGWDGEQTARFLKEVQIQPGSEPELRADYAPAEPVSVSSPGTVGVTVVERRRPTGSGQTPRPADAGRGGIVETLTTVSAVGAIGLALALAGGWRYLPPQPTTPSVAPERQPAEIPSASVRTVAPTTGSLAERTAAAQPAVAVSSVPARPGRRGPVAKVPDAVASLAASELPKRRRRRPPRRAPAPGEATVTQAGGEGRSDGQASPINLKRGDVVPTF